MKKLVFFLLILWLIPLFTFSQSNLRMSAGFGYPSGIHFSSIYHEKAYQFEFVFGLPAIAHEMDRGYYWGLNMGVRFGKEENKAQVKPWIIRLGPSFYEVEDQWEVERRSILMATLGREFNFTSRLGCELMIGPIITMSEKTTVKEEKPSSWFGNVLDDELPIAEARAMIFYRF
tara:strand:+ start:6575 stop:7096 length:522 start_codon:yes stop_codon:yes gene_type:complete